jgi:hypothetical protein
MKDTRELAIGSAKRTVLLVTSSRCHFCEESMPYYGKLVEAARRAGTRVIALSSEPTSDNRAFFAAHGVPIDAAASAPENGIFVRGTLTVIVIRQDGAVLGSWTGMLSAPVGDKVLQMAAGS